MGAAQSVAPASDGRPDDLRADESGEKAVSEVYKTSLNEAEGDGEEVAGGYTGGVAGGADALAKYETTVYSLGKEDMIRKLAAELGPVFGLKDLSKKSVAEIVKALNAKLPDPRKGRKTDTPDKVSAGSHDKVCRALGQALNNMYGRNIINLSGDVNAICNDSVEVVNTLFSGLQSEFVAVARDVEASIKAIETMQRVLKSSRESLVERVDKSDDEILRREAGAVRDFMDRTDQELERQMALLRNSMSVALAPARDSLMLAIKEQKNLSGYFRDFKQATGRKLGEKLSYMLVSAELLATVAASINRALKDVGMSVDEYKKIESNSSLDDAIYNLMNKKLKHASVRELTKFVNASEILRKNNYRHGDISKMLSSSASKSGGRPKKLDEQIAKSRKNRDVLRREFSMRLNKLYTRLLNASTAVVHEVGKAIPLSDDLAKYGRALDRLDESLDVSTTSFAKALLGEFVDANAREVRSQFLANLRAMAKAADALKSGPMGVQFSDVSKAVTAVAELADNFTDIMKAAKKVTANVAAPADTDDDTVLGGDDDDKCVSDVARSTSNLKRAMAEFRYFYRSANLTVSMKVAAAARDKCTDGYLDLVGEAIGLEITDIESAHAEEIKVITELDDAIADKDAKDVVKKYLTARKNARVGLYKTLEAVDAYLGAFTDGVAKNPADVGKLVKILEGLNIAVKWYNEKSGDRLVELYETMPNAGGVQSGLAVRTAGAGHYYDDLVSKQNVGRATSLVAPSAQVGGQSLVLDLLKRAKKAVCAVGALKNLVSLFVSVGSEFGDKNVLKKIPLTPNQINKNLADYVQLSTFGHNAAAAAPTSKVEFDAKYSITMRRVGAGVDAGDAALASLEKEDKALNNLLKAMSAKTLTAVGAYAMLTQGDDAGRGRPTDPIRMVLGGGEVDAKSENAELYIRLTLLVEFYRDIFNLGDAVAAGAPDLAITLVPEFNNVWGNLINLVFDRTKYLKNGNYSDAQVSALVSEINEIAHLYRSRNSKVGVRDILNEFISEINCRYGVYKKAELEAWIAENKFKAYDGKKATLDDATNFEILPGEDEPEYPRPAASDKYIQLPRGEGNPEAVRLDAITQDVVEAFVGKLTAALDLGKNKGLMANNEGFTYSLDENVRQVRARLDGATAAERLAVVGEAVRTSNQVAGMASGRVLMFHETVVAPMSAAAALLQTMQNYVADATALNDGGTDDDDALVTLVEILWTLQGDCDGLVDARIEGENNVLVDVSGVADLIDNLLSGARANLDRFRLSLPRAVLEKYEQDVGGLQELESRADVLLRGVNSESNSVNRAANALNDVMGSLVSTGNDLSEGVSALVAWGATGPGGETGPVGAAPTGHPINSLLVNAIEGPSAAVVGAAPGNPAAALWGDGVKNSGSLVVAHNRLVAAHLNVVYDNATLKVLGAAVAPLVDGAAHRAVMNPDNAAAALDVGANAALPTAEQAVLSKDLAYVLKRLSLETNKKGDKSVHIEKDAADIPNYTKEAYRGNLPIVEVLAKLLVKRANLLRSVLSSKVNVPNRADLEAVVDSVVAQNADLQKCVDAALRAADYAPKWGETGRDSAAQYRSQNGKDPLVPASLALGALEPAAGAELQPNTVPGTVAFKYNYLVQAMLVKNLGIDDMEGAKRLLNAYNSAATSDVTLDDKKMADTLKAQMRAVRYEVVSRRLNALLCLVAPRVLSGKANAVPKIDSDGALVASAANDLEEINALPRAVSAYGVSCVRANVLGACTAAELVSIVESNNRKRSLEQITGVIDIGGLRQDSDNRSQVRVFNLLDMDVMPIDINALRRDVPLINIMNYSLTWDKVVDQVLDTSGKAALATPRDLLASLLQDPHRALNQTERVTLLGSLMVGLSDTELGRPRYLSDQVYGKVLMRDLNADGLSPNGPANSFDRAGNIANNPQGRPGRGGPHDRTTRKTANVPKSSAVITTASEERANTVLVRNLLMIVNSHRLLRLRMAKEVSRITGPVVKDIKTLDRRVTEFVGNEQVDADAPYSRD